MWWHHPGHYSGLLGDAKSNQNSSGGRGWIVQNPLSHSQGTTLTYTSVLWKVIPGCFSEELNETFFFLNKQAFAWSPLCVRSHQAVLRIHFIEAQELMSKDRLLGGLIKGKSDPYGVIQVGTELFQSKIINESLNPKWNEVYEVSNSAIFVFISTIS